MRHLVFLGYLKFFEKSWFQFFSRLIQSGEFPSLHSMCLNLWRELCSAPRSAPASASWQQAGKMFFLKNSDSFDLWLWFLPFVYTLFKQHRFIFSSLKWFTQGHLLAVLFVTTFLIFLIEISASNSHVLFLSIDWNEYREAFFWFYILLAFCFDLVVLSLYCQTLFTMNATFFDILWIWVT